jgi:hypothetical protein
MSMPQLIVNGLVKLNTKVVTLRETIVSQSGVGYTSKDARHVALDGMQANIVASGMLIQCLLSLENLCHADEQIFCQKVGTGLPARQAMQTMMTYMRLGFATLTHFKIDSLFQNLLRELGVTGKKGFWHTSDAILEELGLLKRGQDKDVLTVLANIRNSLHSNGMHDTDSLTATIGSRTFTFAKGQEVRCASWEDVLTALDANIDVLEKILLSQRISSITSEIEDRFAATS